MPRLRKPHRPLPFPSLPVLFLILTISLSTNLCYGNFVLSYSQQGSDVLFEFDGSWGVDSFGGPLNSSTASSNTLTK